MPTTARRKGAPAQLCPTMMSGAQKPHTAIKTFAKLRFIFLLVQREFEQVCPAIILLNFDYTSRACEKPLIISTTKKGGSFLCRIIG